MVSETNKIVEETTALAGGGFPVDPVLRTLWRGIHRRGACCYDDFGDSVCDDTLTRSGCSAFDGNFIPDAKCIDDPCATGACCCPNDDGSVYCSDDLDQAFCESCCPVCEYQGDGSLCSDAPCGSACCVPDFGCELVADESACDDLGGTYLGDGAVCEDGSCVGACCRRGCFDGYQESECDGEFQGLGTTCADVECPSGACCFDDICDTDYSETYCTNIGGTFQGDGTDCDPNPCDVGACCTDPEVCEDMSSAACSDVAGVFQGFGTTCLDGDCGCSDPAACNYSSAVIFDTGVCFYPPSVDIGCDVSSASASKCGYRIGDTFYRQQTHEFFYSVHASCEHGASGSGDFFEVNNYSSHCETNGVTSRFGSGSCTSSASPDAVFGDCSATTSIISGYCSFSSPYGFLASDLFCDYVYSGSAGAGTICPSGCCCGCDCCGSPDAVSSGENNFYGDEYTTGELISYVESLIPPFSGEFGSGACCSSAFLSSDEATYSEQIAQYKLLFGSSDTSFTVHWVERFSPAGGGGSTDTSRSGSFSAGTTESGVYSLGAPGSNGTTCIVIISVECS